jgi:Fe-S-cluster containining protein
VTFLRTELDDSPGGTVPADMVEPIDDRGVCMRGTAGRSPRCAALQGMIGVKVSCAIYAYRPTPCRAFAADAALGHGDINCGDARRRHGLPPLKGSYDAALMV